MRFKLRRPRTPPNMNPTTNQPDHNPTNSRRAGFPPRFEVAALVPSNLFLAIRCAVPFTPTMGVSQEGPFGRLLNYPRCRGGGAGVHNWGSILDENTRN